MTITEVKHKASDVINLRTWIAPIGSLDDRLQGYAVRPATIPERIDAKQVNLWVSEVWYDKRMCRNDIFDSRDKAIEYAVGRCQSFYPTFIVDNN